MAAASSAGSYDFNALGTASGELDRLQLQARRSAELERSLLLQMGLQDGQDVLDLACGPGVISRLIAETHSASRVTAMDLNGDLLAAARQEAAAAGLQRITFVQGDVYAPPLEPGRFDFIYARLLFQHLEDPLRALQAVRALLKPGGKLCIMDIDDAWLTLVPEPKGFRAFTKAAAQAQARQGGNRNIGRELGRLLEAADFSDVEVHVETVSSRQLGMRAFLDITLGFKRLLLAGDELDAAASTLAAADALVDDPQSWAFVGVFLASGCRP
ncbi:class I SAM-dependent methyltransferase [Vulcanococcus sp.]|uniref:class I SAM-dependent methyltransferase n=1 Tax=Vulcanococcus sp. TaxID=2856995 RepID=UPI003F69AB6B